MDTLQNAKNLSGDMITLIAFSILAGLIIISIISKDRKPETEEDLQDRQW
jgi:hypothetical protein